MLYRNSSWVFSIEETCLMSAVPLNKAEHLSVKGCTSLISFLRDICELQFSPKTQKVT